VGAGANSNARAWSFFHDKISFLWAYELYGPVRNAFDVSKFIMRVSVRGWGPGNRDFFGPCEMA
jgi:hypothetical protein